MNDILFYVYHDLYEDNINDDIDTQDQGIEEIDKKTGEERKDQCKFFIFMKYKIEK